MSVNRYRRSAAIAACIAGSLTIAACSSGSGGGTSENGEVTLTFLEKWPEPQYAPYFKSVVREYEKKNPNVNIKLMAVGDQPIKNKLRVLAASQKLPDIYFSWAGNYAQKFVNAGLAADLTKDLKGTAWGKSLSSTAVDAFTYGGKSYGVPINLDAKVFVYNKALFKKYEVKVPKTMDDLYSACKTFKKNDVLPIDFGNQFGWPAIHYLTALNAESVPRDVRATDYAGNEGAKFTNSGYAKALDTLTKIQKNCMSSTGVNGISHDSARADWSNGKSAMIYVETLEFPDIAKANKSTKVGTDWSFFKMPRIPGAQGTSSSIVGAPDGFLVNGKSENKDEAVKFLKYFTNKENAQKMVEDLGWLSSVHGAATPKNTSPQLRGALKAINAASHFDIWLDTVTKTQVASAYLSGTEGLLGGSKTPSAVMKSVKDAAEQSQDSAE